MRRGYPLLSCLMSSVLVFHFNALQFDMRNRRRSTLWFDFVLMLGLLASTRADGNGKVQDENGPCSGNICSSSMSMSTTAQPEAFGEQSCSEYTDGWGLKGSDWGCCGNYDGCCLYASLICYFHDAMCRCCDIGDNFCGPTCKPEVDCLGDFGGNRSEESFVKTDENLKVDEDDINKNDSSIGNNLNVKTPDTFNISNDVTEDAASVFAESQSEYLDVEEIEQALNSTENFDSLGFEIEKLLNETETLLDEHDELFVENGSGETVFKPEI